MVHSRVIAATGIACALVASAWFFSQRSDAEKSAREKKSVSEKAQSDTRVSVEERGAPSLGRDDAPVTIIEFADFQCPLCALFHFGAGAVIFEEFVKTGKARFVFKQFPLLGEESFFAAYGAGCAKEKGKFWEYHDLLFAKQSQSEGENSGVFSVANLVRIAEEAGLEKNEFAQCVREEKYKSAALADAEDGRKAGVEGTPTVFINGRKMSGALPYAAYKKVIEEELR